MADLHPMPRRDEVDPDFDGHLERPFAELTADERIEWIWETMQLLHLARPRGPPPLGPYEARRPSR